MTESDDDLRATAEDIAADASRLAEIETEKASLPSDDPNLLGLSKEGEKIARGLVPKTVAERAIVEEAAEPTA